MKDYQSCPCLQSRKSALSITNYFNKHLRPSGINITEMHLLASARNASCLTEVAQDLGVDRTTISRRLKILKKTGYITMHTPSDKRKSSFSITEKGGSALELASNLWVKANNLLATTQNTCE